nr:hypothetical protein 2 [Ginkgo biloba dicistrovirus]
MYDRGSHIGTLTNLPHVRLDLSEKTMCELRVPFHNIEPYLATDFIGSFGAYTFAMLHPMRLPPGGSPPDYQVLLSLEDVTLYGAKPLGFQAITLQSGVQARESKGGTKGLISGPLGVASKIATIVAGVPSLSSIAGPTAWMLNHAAKAASYFGYSKPAVGAAHTVVYRQDDGMESNVDVPAAVSVVGQFAANQQMIGPALGNSDVDEMALKYITGQYSQIARASVNGGNLHNTVVYSTLVMPVCFWYRDAQTSANTSNILPPYSSLISTTNGNSFIPSSLMNITQMFKLWRGGITFRFSVAKTKMHGGRMLINYYPEIFKLTSVANPLLAPLVGKGAESSTGFVQPSGHSILWDLKDSPTIEFTVPHIVEEPWLTPTTSVGTLSMTVVDRVVSSAAIADTIDFIVEVKGAEDFELAGFTGPQFVQYPTGGTIWTQSGMVETTHNDPKPYTVGESVSSIKQLIMTPTLVIASVANNLAARAIVPPWFWNALTASIGRGLTSPIPVTTTFVGSGNHLGQLAALYIYAKGGTDLHIYPTSSTNSQRITVDAPTTVPAGQSSGSTATQPLYGANINAASVPRVINTLDRPTHVRLPALFKSLRAVTSFLGNSGLSYFGTLTGSVPTFPSTLADVNQPTSGLYRLIINNTTGATQNYVIRMAAADDAQLAHYIGPVPFIIPNNASTNNLYPDYPL